MDLERVGRAPFDGLVVVAMAWLAGALARVALIEVAFGTAVVLVALATAGRRFVATLAALAFAFAAWRGERCVARFADAHAVVVAAGRWPAICTVHGTVVQSPSFGSGALRLQVDVHRSACDGAQADTRVALFVPDEVSADVTVARGDVITALVRVAPPQMFWNEDHPWPSLARRGAHLSGVADDVVIERPGRGILAWIDRMRASTRRRIRASYPLAVEAMVRALVLGEDDLDPTLREAFRKSGLSHLLAVSGMHLVLVVLGFVAALRALVARVAWIATRVPPARLASALGIGVAWVYADLAGGSGSAIRAAWMTTVALTATLLGRRSDGWRAFGLSLVAMAISDPLAPFDLSFALSVAATAGLLVLARPLDAWAIARVPWLPRFVRQPLCTTAAASSFCAPLVALLSDEVPLAGAAANLVAVPLGEVVALPLCLLHAVASPLSHALGVGTATTATGALTVVAKIATTFASVPHGTVSVPTPTAAELVVLVVGVVLAGLARARRWRFAAGTLLLLSAFEALARRQGMPHDVLRVTFLDVAQGDAALLDFPDGRAMLIDGGGLVGVPLDVGERAVAPLLRRRRRNEVDWVVLSHPHPDHFLGLPAAVAGRRVGEFWHTAQDEPAAIRSTAPLLRTMRAKGARILGPADLCGRRAVGGAWVEVLAPCPGPRPDLGANDNSFVLLVTYGERSFLFVGDAEREAEQGLLERSALLRADVLKVGHHGSRTSTTPPFLARVNPSVAIVSSGVRNRFGHPHAETLRTLAGAGAAVHRTDREGAVVVVTDGRSLEVTTSVR